MALMDQLKVVGIPCARCFPSILVNEENISVHPHLSLHCRYSSIRQNIDYSSLELSLLLVEAELHLYVWWQSDEFREQVIVYQVDGLTNASFSMVEVKRLIKRVGVVTITTPMIGDDWCHLFRVILIDISHFKKNMWKVLL